MLRCGRCLRNVLLRERRRGPLSENLCLRLNRRRRHWDEDRRLRRYGSRL